MEYKRIESETELKPCPFCGGEVEVRQHISFDETDSRDGLYSVGCCTDKCIGEYAHNFYFSEAEAIKAWNTRHGELDAYQDGMWAQFRRDFKTCHSERTDCFECSECAFFDAYAAPDDFNYCPNCGAKVVE